jgi:hypothetical protein
VIACGSATRARRSRAARGKESRQRYSRKAVLCEWCGIGTAVKSAVGRQGLELGFDDEWFFIETF